METVLSLHPLPNKHLKYGTAGFRESCGIGFNSTFVRMGILACLRSLSMDGKCVGLVVTASHNPEIDNGIKIVDPDGGMFDQSWEPHAEYLANASASDALCFIEKLKSNLPAGQATVIVGCDTRPHSREFTDNVILGIQSFGGVAVDLGEVTTPVVHFTIRNLNENSISRDIDAGSCLQTYDQTLARGYHMLFGDRESVELVLDCSNGVGSLTVNGVIAAINNLKDSSLKIDIRNAAKTGPVNDLCGAEFVQKSRAAPSNVLAPPDSDKLLCSFDGDADRVVFHAFSSKLCPGSLNWMLFDGDKIAALISLFLQQELAAAGLSEYLSFGVVQTAYANGASTHFFQSHNVPVLIAKTGVKYIHPKAHQFDVGVYFEANGHGTTVFSKAFLSAVEEATQPVDSRAPGYRKALALWRLKACTFLVNQAVGDAISDMLLTVCALQLLDIDFLAWDKFYCDLPSKMIKVTVPNKDVVVCNEDETRTTAPLGLQEALDEAMIRFAPMGRTFIRPSGTEDVVRIYAEASSADEVEVLLSLAVEAIRKYVG